MLSITTNTSSLIAQNSLKTSTNKLNTAIERMSTGAKINHAKDNAANYSIATNMTTKINALQVAEDNCASGLDLISTASGSLDLISDKLSRLRALATQAQNGTYGNKSLSAINAEATALMNEMYRIQNNTEYNGSNILGETVGPDMDKLAVNENGFIQDVKQRNTDSMTSLESVNESAVLAKGTYSISSAGELAKLARMQNSGKITAGSEFVLAADIDLSGYSNWTPIGFESNNTQTSKAFAGTFDGNGYKISNLKATNGQNSAVGLFGTADKATFKNVGIENVNISARSTGSLVAIVKDNSSIEVTNCYAKDVTITSIDTGSAKGGLIGGVQYQSILTATQTNIDISSCYVENLNLNDKPWGRIGGIVGESYNITAENCFSTFNITSKRGIVGGIVGLSIVGTIDNCCANGTMNELEYSMDITTQGGIGNGDLTIRNCYFEGTLEGCSTEVGGIIAGCYGNNPVYIENCMAKANITGLKHIGGIIGWQDCEGGSVKNCYFDGTLTGTDNSTTIGSIVGGGVEDLLTVENCFYNKNSVGTIPIIGDNLGTVLGNSAMKTLQVGINSDENSQIGFEIFFNLGELMTLSINGIQSSNASNIIDQLSEKINSIQTSLGAVQNRLDSALDEIATQYDNLVSSRSTIKDADISEVSSDYIKQQILQEASATLLATANQTPALALQLL